MSLINECLIILLKFYFKNIIKKLNILIFNTLIIHIFNENLLLKYLESVFGKFVKILLLFNNLT
jgi:hypothetical protein